MYQLYQGKINEDLGKKDKKLGRFQIIHFYSFSWLIKNHCIVIQKEGQTMTKKSLQQIQGVSKWSDIEKFENVAGKMFRKCCEL